MSNGQYRKTVHGRKQMKLHHITNRCIICNKPILNRIGWITCGSKECIKIRQMIYARSKKRKEANRRYFSKQEVKTRMKLFHRKYYLKNRLRLLKYAKNYQRKNAGQ